MTTSIWQPASAATYPKVDADLEADVLVVGGGITGMTAALRLAEIGKKVILVEANTIASGVTGHTSAHLTAFVDPRYADITERFGVAGAKLVASSAIAAMDHIESTAQRHGIACDLQRVPGYLYTEQATDRDTIEAELEASKDAGLDVTLDAIVPLPFSTAGSILYPNQLRFHPRKYVEGLAQVARAAGVAIYEETRIVEVKDGEPVVTKTDGGKTIAAKAVFLATHTPLNMFLVLPKLAHYQSYVVAFEDVPVQDGLYWDTAEPYHYLRTAIIDGKSYLLVGGEDHKTGEEKHTEGHFDELVAYAKARFGVGSPAFSWSAQVVEPADGLPYIGRNAAAKHVFIATGFSGNGLTYGTTAALVVSDLILGNDNPYADLFHVSRLKASAIGPILADSVSVPMHMAERLRGAEVESADQIALGEGCTLKSGGKRLAVYRDENGGLHAVSAICPHAGCVVKFNGAAKTWDCPCHGSRFDVEGKVLDGPAVTGLEKHAL